MRSALSVSFGALLCALALPAQTKPIEQGLEPDWDVRAVLKEISAHAGRLVPMLNQVDPKSWVSKGAPDAYIAQWNTIKAQSMALSGDALALTKDPEKLSEALKVFFRMQSLEFMLNSLGQGVRRYQSGALADSLTSLVAENGANRERLQRYIVDLAADREQEFAIMNHEAQRCRSILVQQPVTPAHRTGRK